MTAASSKLAKRALVIGAGSSGITALSELLAAGIDAVIYEARGEVGGAWNYDADPKECLVSFESSGRCVVLAPGEGEAGAAVPRSAMYDSLRTNVPQTLMAYREQPFPYDTPLFPPPSTIKSYLDISAASLLPNINLNHQVTLLRWTTPQDGGEQREWLVEAALPDGATCVDQFDVVVVANGHYTQPYIPPTEGLDGWKGEIRHSRWYRSPDRHADQNVLVIGNSASGYDITRQIAQHHFEQPADSRRKVYQSRKAPSSLGLPFDAPDAAEWAKAIGIYPPIERMEDRTIWFEDGRTLTDVDLIYFATGYLYSFPFASPSNEPFASHPLTRSPTPTSPTTPPGGLRVHHLDSRQLLYLPSPTLSFLALPLLIIPFPLAEAQSRFLAAYYSDTLPAPLKIEEGTPEDADEERKAHLWGFPKEADESDQLLREAGDGGEGGKWGRAEQGRRDLRMGCMGLRKAVLGY